MSHETFQTLLMKAVDDRLTPEERRLLDEHLQTCQSCREEFEDFRKIKKSTDGVGSRIMQDAAAMPPRESRGRTRLVLAATALFLAGLFLLLGFSAHAFFTDGDVPIIVKLSVSSLAIGSMILAGIAFHQRLHGQSRDPYKEIDL